MPYSMLAGSLPHGKTGVYMGIFNFFIVIPEIIASLGFGWVMGHLLNNDRIAAVVAGGIFFILAAMLTQRVEDLYDLRQPSSSLPGKAVAAKS
jgi:maltose/moltooligosaccharide transporter